MARELTLQEKIQRLHDIRQVQHVMSRYEYLHAAGLQEQMADLFARKAAGVTSGNNNFVVVGAENVRNFMLSVGRGGPKPGTMNLHLLTTPVIEVARDGQTAQGLWLSPGAESFIVEGKPDAHWTSIRIASDFIKEDEEWKLWHYHRFDVYEARYGESWVAEATGETAPPRLRKLPEGAKPSAHSWSYSRTTRVPNIPAPPEPYDTWSDARSSARYQLPAGA